MGDQLGGYIGRKWAEFASTEATVIKQLEQPDAAPSLASLIDAVKNSSSSGEEVVRGAIWDLIERNKLTLTWDGKVVLNQ